MPLIDCGVILQPGIGAGPCGMCNLFPQICGLDPLGNTLVTALDQLPVTLIQNGLQEFIAYPHRIVGILPGDGQIGF